MEAKIWEAAWTEYVEALDACDADWSGDGFVVSAGCVARRLADAQRNLWAIDAAFCRRLGI